MHKAPDLCLAQRRCSVNVSDDADGDDVHDGGSGDHDNGDDGDGDNDMDNDGDGDHGDDVVMTR